ncbi:acid shock protein, partial [Citrobacter sp. Cf125]
KAPEQKAQAAKKHTKKAATKPAAEQKAPEQKAQAAKKHTKKAVKHDTAKPAAQPAA